MLISRNCKLPAFTLVEVLMVITISCLFVSMVYASVRFYLHAYIRDKAMQQESIVIWNMEGNLLHDVETSQILNWSHEDSLLICTLPSGNLISYRFHMNYLLRRQGLRLDTLKVKCSELIFRFNGQPVESGIIDYLAITTKYKQTFQQILFYKTYTPEVLFNHIDTVKFKTP